ncbi:hypothetical protein E4634_10455 [Mangrovimicrobium sediminis]|uniref:Lipoprotein n=1 Tax=Mangrovimicrobium sediminis TaxID=2562682 RepID=A0A4Z0M1Y5_9GAMM|nr:hypothetical protein [Haliea sp. SAOS-164]TGD73447.1 hypothetical protein E4634_10455 [Haliea sp. SAOS-164]
MMTMQARAHTHLWPALCLSLALTACSGGGGGSSTPVPEEPEVPPVPEEPVVPEGIRVYQLGDTVDFSGTRSETPAGGQTTTGNVTAQLRFLPNVYSNDDKNVLAAELTVTVEGTGQEIVRTVHIWQEADGTLYDLTDLYGNFYTDAATNETGIIAVPLPLIPFTEVELSFYTMFGGNTSTPLTMGERSISMGEPLALSVPLGTFDTLPVTGVDDFEYLVSFDIYKRDQRIVDELTRWFSAAAGVVKWEQTTRRYSVNGNLEMTYELRLEAEATSFTLE